MQTEVQLIRSISNVIVDCRPASHLPPPDLDGGVKRSKYIFSEYGHIANQTKENHECSNMLANILPADPAPETPDPGMGSVGQNSTFSEHGHVTYQIKEIKNAPTW